jgi:hypothetical protein
MFGYLSQAGSLQFFGVVAAPKKCGVRNTDNNDGRRRDGEKTGLDGK